MSTQDEKRRSERCPVTADVQVRCAKGVVLEGTARDLSMGGVWFDTEASLPVRHPVHVEITAGSGDAVVHAVLDGTVVRKAEGGLAIEFEEVSADGCACLDTLMHGASSVALV